MIAYIRKLIALSACTAGLGMAAEDLVYRFPTDNRTLLEENRGNDFYMYCDRNFEGEKSKPWQAGGYGMVRNPFRASNGQIMFSRLHEGIDIKPLKRDAQGEPLDAVRPIAPGKVVHAVSHPGLSNYGRYVVIAHDTPEGTIYSLYAHLAKVSCSVGQHVGTGNELGVMGHSGVGLNRERSHVHLEICLMIHSKYDQFCSKENKHGLYNGLNLIGIDPSAVLLACKDGNPLSLTEHWANMKEHYRVRVPWDGRPVDILQRHPFLKRGEWSPAPKSLDVAFSAEGVPLAVYPSQEQVSEPKVVRCAAMPTLQQNVTMNRVKNSSRDPKLTASGLRYISQYFWQKINASSANTSPAPASAPDSEPAAQ